MVTWAHLKPYFPQWNGTFSITKYLLIALGCICFSNINTKSPKRAVSSVCMRVWCFFGSMPAVLFWTALSSHCFYKNFVACAPSTCYYLKHLNEGFLWFNKNFCSGFRFAINFSWKRETHNKSLWLLHNMYSIYLITHMYKRYTSYFFSLLLPLFDFFRYNLLRVESNGKNTRKRKSFQELQCF